MTLQIEDTSFVGDSPAAADRSALADRRELALVAVERTRMPMVVSDPTLPDAPIVLANEAFLKLTGYGADEVIGRNCRFLQGRDTDPVDVQKIRDGLANHDDHVAVELLNYRKDGSTFWNQLNISPVHDERGRVIYYFASQKDVTARRRAEALETSERLLLREVDHRAMNALALVQSIVRLSRADSIEDFSALVLGRVDALARAHRLLAASGWKGEDLGRLVREETPATLAARVAAAGPSLTVPAGIVQPLMLILHEMMANAVRHGALSVADGTLRIGWRTDGDDLMLDWTETGGPAPPTPIRTGFGLTIVEGIAERQLNGRTTLDWPATGLHARLTIPCARRPASRD